MSPTAQNPETRTAPCPPHEWVLFCLFSTYGLAQRGPWNECVHRVSGADAPGKVEVTRLKVHSCNISRGSQCAPRRDSPRGAERQDGAPGPASSQRLPGPVLLQLTGPPAAGCLDTFYPRSRGRSQGGARPPAGCSRLGDCGGRRGRGLTWAASPQVLCMSMREGQEVRMDDGQWTRPYSRPL